MERVLFPEYLTLALAVSAMLGFTFWYHRFSETTVSRAYDQFETAMRDVSQRLQLRYRPGTPPREFGGVSGRYRDRQMAIFAVSDEGTSTIVQVYFETPLADETLAKLKGRLSWERVRAKVRASKAELSPAQSAQLEKVLAIPNTGNLELDANEVSLTLRNGKHSFFSYDMLTDVDKLVAATEDLLNLAFALELQ